MLLPKNERRSMDKIAYKKIWLYAPPFAGKTTLANKFPDPLFLNTDGNINSFDGAYLRVKDEVTTNGRITTRKSAWEVFKDIIAELEKKENDFKTIVVDLLEDTYEYCRLYCYGKLGVEHESEAGFGKGYDTVKTEFLSTMKRLMNLDYENIILLSHEDTTKDITKKSGDKVTTIKPNINDKTALKIAGMVDVVCRIVVDGENRRLSFKTDEVVFGGGRLSITNTEIPLEYDALMKVYDDANQHAKSSRPARQSVPVSEEKPAEPQPEIADEPTPEPTPVEEPAAAEPVAEPQAAPTRSRRVRA